MACPGSVRLAEQAPERPSSAYAEEGTFAHALAERCLLAGMPSAAPFIGKPVKHPEVDSEKLVISEMVAAVDVYLRAVWDEYDEATCELEVEQRFAISAPAADDGEVFGTNDACVFNRVSGKLTVFDYKHGQGVIVDVANNTQFKFYALGALQAHPEWDVRAIDFVVVQPRAANAGDTEGVHRWALPMYETLEFPDDLNDAIAEAKGDNPRFASGEHCRWCPAATICTVREQQFLEAVNSDYGDLASLSYAVGHTPNVPVVEHVEHMTRVIEAYEALGGWIGQLRQRIDEILLSGGEVPGWKVVEKVARRKWAAAGEDVAAHLALQYGVPEDMVMPKKLETVTEVKRLLKSFVDKKEYADAERDLTVRFTVKEASGLTTAPVSDKRLAVSPIEAQFGDVVFGDEQ